LGLSLQTAGPINSARWRELANRAALAPGVACDALDADGFHQSCHAFLAAGETSVDKISHYARRTICAIAGLVALLD